MRAHGDAAVAPKVFVYVDYAGGIIVKVEWGILLHVTSLLGFSLLKRFQYGAIW